MGVHFGNTVRKHGSFFSYACVKCSKCCYGKGIQVNPYEIMRLSVFLETDSTSFRGKYLDGQFLRHKDSSGSCIFLDESGCGVHKDRPLVCRLYPLGRIRYDDGEEIFPEVIPHAECKGIYGESDTVEKYLESQDTGPYFRAEKSYREIINKMTRAVSVYMAKAEIPKTDLNEFSEKDPGWILDPDPVIRKYCDQKKTAFPCSVDEKLAVHLEALNAWVEGEWEPV